MRPRRRCCRVTATSAAASTSSPRTSQGTTTSLDRRCGDDQPATSCAGRGHCAVRGQGGHPTAGAAACICARTESSSSGCSLHAVRVAPLNAHGWRRSIAGRNPSGPTASQCACDGALGADHRRERGRQLGDVVGEQQVRRRAFTEAEVDRPGYAVVGEEDVREPKIAVCDAMCARRSSTCSQIASSTSSVSSSDRETVERPALDRLVREHERVRLRGRQRNEAWRADADARPR